MKNILILIVFIDIIYCDIPLNVAFDGKISLLGDNTGKSCGSSYDTRIDELAGVSDKYFSVNESFCNYCLKVEYHNKSITLPIRFTCVNCTDKEVFVSFRAMIELEYPPPSHIYNATLSFIDCSTAPPPTPSLSPITVNNSSSSSSTPSTTPSNNASFNFAQIQISSLLLLCYSLSILL